MIFLSLQPMLAMQLLGPPLSRLLPAGSRCYYRPIWSQRRVFVYEARTPPYSIFVGDVRYIRDYRERYRRVARARETNGGGEISYRYATI